MKTYRIDVGDYAWFLMRAPQCKPHWLDFWFVKNVPENDLTVREATEQDIKDYEGLYVWKLTDSWDDDDLEDK